MAPKKKKAVEVDELKALQVKMLKKVEKHLDDLLAVALPPKVEVGEFDLTGFLERPPLPPLDFGATPSALQHRLSATIPLLANIATAREAQADAGHGRTMRYVMIEEFILSDIEETVEKLKAMKAPPPELK